MVLSERMQRFVRRMQGCTYVTYKDYEQQHHAVMIIQKHWRRCISDPAYSVCKNRLMNEFNEISA